MITLIHEIAQGFVTLWHVVAPFIPFALIGGAVASVLLEFAKNWLLDPKHKKLTLLLKQIFVGGTLAVHAIMAVAPDSATSILIRGLLTTVASSGLYAIFLKPLYGKLSDAAATYNAGKTAAAPTDNPQLPTTTHTFEA